MTAEELRRYFNTEFTKDGINTPWPETFEVDSETWINAVQAIIKNAEEVGRLYSNGERFEFSFYLGRNLGPLFKNVELILKK